MIGTGKSWTQTISFAYMVYLLTTRIGTFVSRGICKRFPRKLKKKLGKATIIELTRLNQQAKENE